MSFESRETGRLALRNDLADAPEMEEYEVIELLDFNSDRKRMSVVCRRVAEDAEPGPVTIYCKGADTVMEPRLRAGQDETTRARWASRCDVGGDGAAILPGATIGASS